MIRTLLRGALAVAAALIFTTGTALADWPSKPIQIIIPWPAPNDPSTLVATAMAPVMSKELGVPVKVVNKPGGGAVLGANDIVGVAARRLHHGTDLDRPDDHPGAARQDALQDRGPEAPWPGLVEPLHAGRPRRRALQISRSWRPMPRTTRSSWPIGASVLFRR